MKRTIIFLGLAFLLAGCATNKIQDSSKSEIKEELKPLYVLREVEGEKVAVDESWGFISLGREDEFDLSMPVTDVCYFSADIGCYGQIIEMPDRSRLDIGERRCHLVVTCDSRGTMHQILEPSFNKMESFIDTLIVAAEPFDGLQIDFEYIPVKDKEYFYNFLEILQGKLDGKMFSVCVPGRTKLLENEVFDYAEVSKYCDRVFIMAYDEHWSTSKPGAIASTEWSRNVCNFAMENIPKEKIIMGIPFYGRTWASEKTATAWYFSGIEKQLIKNKVQEINYEDDIPSFNYTVEVNVTGYFNDAYACVSLCRIYDECDVHKVGYWRIGQEDPEFWNWISIKQQESEDEFLYYAEQNSEDFTTLIEEEI